jgi:hypothetical protein
MVFHPYIPLALWVPLALAAVGLVAAYAVAARRRIARRRRVSIIALMAVTLAAPLVVLLNPTWVQTVPPPPGKRLLTVLADRTASMATPDAEGGRTRFQAAQQVADELTRSLGEAYEVRVRVFDEVSKDLSAAQLAGEVPDGGVTNLARALEGALGEDRPQGQAILLASDGVDTSGTPAARLWQAADKGKALSTPIYTRAIGSQRGVDDLEVSLKNLPQELAFVGQKIPVVARLRHSGKDPATARLTLTLDGEAIESHDISLPASGQVEQLLFVSQESAGLYRYQLRAESLEGEVTDLNNAASLLVRVIDEPVSVLLLEGKPYWDTKFLVRTLSADPSIELVSIVQMAPGRFLQRRIVRDESGDAIPAERAPINSPGDDDLPEEGVFDTTPPVRIDPEPSASGWKIHTDARQFLGDKEFLKSFQIAVLGRNAEAFLSDETLVDLRRWLQEDDGALVCFRGSPAAQLNERLGALMPVRWTPGRESRFRLAFTDDGAAMQWLPGANSQLSSLPSVAAAARPEEPKPLATVLATSTGDADQSVPLITWRPEGSGRVVVVEGAGMWRWAFLPPEHQQHDETYGTLWRSLIRWLVSNVGLLPAESIALRPDAVTFRSTQAATATLLVRESDWPKPPVIELSGDALPAPKQFTPAPQPQAEGMYRVNFGQLPEGRYTARVTDPEREEKSQSGDKSPHSKVKTEFEVTGNLQERLEIVARPDVLAEIAKRSGGAALQTSDAQELTKQFDEHLARTRPQRVIRTSAWDRWWVLAGIFGLWAATWAVRRWSGLV